MKTEKQLVEDAQIRFFANNFRAGTEEEIRSFIREEMHKAYWEGLRLKRRANRGQRQAVWNAQQKHILAVMLDYGLSPIEAERIFESKKNFEAGLKDVIEKELTDS